MNNRGAGGIVRHSSEAIYRVLNILAKYSPYTQNSPQLFYYGVYTVIIN